MNDGGIKAIICETEEDDYKDYADDAMPRCPKCGAKPYISRDIVDGFYFGWSVGCPRFRHNDGIHGTTFDTKEEDWYAIHYLDSAEECREKWVERVKRLNYLKKPNG